MITEPKRARPRISISSGAARRGAVDVTGDRGISGGRRERKNSFGACFTNVSFAEAKRPRERGKPIQLPGHKFVPGLQYISCRLNLSIIPAANAAFVRSRRARSREKPIACTRKSPLSLRSTLSRRGIGFIGRQSMTRRHSSFTECVI